jgi:hypothetical protein
MSEFDIVAVTKTIVRSVATAFPPLAPWVNAWNEHEGVETQRRLDLFRDAFIFEAKQNADRFEKLDQSVELARAAVQVLERAVEAARREPSEVKLQAIARVTANAVAAGDAIPQDDKLTLLEAMDTLTKTDLDVLGAFATGGTVRVEKMVASTFGREALTALGRLVASLGKLESRGLIAETSHKGAFNVTSSVGDPEHWRNRWLNKDFEILPLGKMLVELLKEGGGTVVAPAGQPR